MKRQRVILAVDPFHPDPRAVGRIASALAALTRGKLTEIEPVAVVHPRDFTLSEVFFGKIEEIGDEIRERIAVQIRRATVRVKLPGLIEPKVLLSPPLAPRNPATRLLAYAEERNVDLIALGRHARSDISRAFLGSFAETLALRSRIPLFVVDPRVKLLPTRLHRILFPTDLSAKSREGLGRVVRGLDGQRAEIRLFHQIEPIPALPLEGVGPLPLPGTSARELAREREAVLERWVAELKREAPDIRFVVEVSARPTPLLPALLRAARRGEPGMVAMVSETGPLSSVLLGSVTRQVLRHAPLPVWVTHV